MSTFSHILVTGGYGFIGSHFVRQALSRWPEAKITNFDLPTYAGNPANLADVEDDPRYRFIQGDVRNADDVLKAMDGCDAAVHFAAESHVDRSILASDDFMTTNIMGTHVMLEAARNKGVKRFLFVSTDEVYGSLEEPHVATEDYPIKPNSPYSASKASADLLVRSHFVTYNAPVIITRSSNNFGPNQYPEKLIPLFVTNLISEQKIPLYGDGLNIRNWIYVTDNCSAIARVLEAGRFGEAYNIGSDDSMSNLQLTRRLLSSLGLDESHIEYVTDRPGHDRRYALDSSKIKKELAWQAEHTFEEALLKTVEWYRNNESWWQPIKSGQYRQYYEKQYGSRTATVI